jgi:glucokinase
MSKHKNMIVLTLDAGGTNFVFTAIKDGKIIGDKIKIPSNGDNLELCLNGIVSGFTQLLSSCKEKVDAISFAFPGPADFSAGIIGDLHNLTGFRGGVALGPMLKEKFGIPVFINNDGDLYAFGEALAGTLPFINQKLAAVENTRKYKNLVGMTIGTGFGAGLVHDNMLIKGDNICAGEIWITSNRVDFNYNSEEGVSIRAIKHFYAEYAHISFENTPEPKTIFEIAKGRIDGDKEAAKKAYEKLGRFIGDSIANMITLFDGIVVIGGGIAGAKELIIPGIQAELNHNFKKLDGSTNKRLTQKAFCLNLKHESDDFLKNYTKEITVPGTNKAIQYDDFPRNAYIFSEFDTSEMINLGAFYFAKENLKTKIYNIV